MPPQADSWRDRPSAGQSGSTSAAFAYALEPPQHAQQTSPRDGTTYSPESATDSVAPQPQVQSSMKDKSTIKEDDGANRTSAGAVADQIDQLEDEVVHFMNLSMEEKEKAEVLLGRLESVMQEKGDLERQVDALDQDLSQIDWQDQGDGASPIDTADTISRVYAKITTLCTTAQKLENDLNLLGIISEQQTKTITELEEQLRVARLQLAQKTQEEEHLRKELEQAKVDLKSEKMTNDEIRGSMKSIEQARNDLRISNDRIGKKLTEAEQTTDTLSDLVKRKVAELEGAQKAAASQAEITRQKLDHKQEEIDGLKATWKELHARCEKSESALRERPVVRRQHLGGAEAVVARSLREKEEDAMTIKKLTEDLQRNQMRRVRAVAVAIDLSGSAAGSLTEGIKKIYAHLLGELQRSPLQTYVMTVIHGPGNTVAVKSNFGDTWAAHEKVLEGQKADGMEQHVACLRKIKEVAVNTGMCLDFQVVLLGDSHANQTSHFGSREICHDFACSNPTVHIHSVVVKTGSAEETEKYWNNLKPWPPLPPLSYASATGGNMTVWGQNSPLPDLSNFVF